MAFMLVATLTYLIMKISKLSSSIVSGSAVWGDWFQIFFAIAMVILAVFLVGEALNTFKKQKAARKAKA
jgi:cation transport ATPase